MSDALAAANLGAASLGTPAEDPNTFVFQIPNTETNISILLGNIPAEIRLDMLKKAIKDYVTNSVNQANLRAKKAGEPWDQYEAAAAADPLQTAVKKPDGDRPVADLLKTAAEARERLYKGEVRKQGEGTSKPTADPLTKLVTDAVVRELYTKRKAADSKVKYTDITSEVSKAGGGIKFLEERVAEAVAKGGDEATLRKFMDERYINPAKMMLGQKDNKATKDVSLF